MILATTRVCDTCRHKGALHPPATGHCYMFKKIPTNQYCEAWKMKKPDAKEYDLDKVL